MREIQEGDVILHLVDNRGIVGVSTATANADSSFNGINETEWSGTDCYLVKLNNFEKLEPEIHRESFLKEAPYKSILGEIRDNHERLFYNSEFKLNQGSYLTRCPEKLAQVFNEIYKKSSGNLIPHLQEIGGLDINHAIPNRYHPEFRNFALECSLLSKPFTILTGASGTGKTKLATTLADYLSAEDNSAIVPVGSDWTDNRPVLGFVNHLRQHSDGRPIFQTTPIVDLLLRADANPELPHFLILDEMNLSHVERYFADFLSAMEQKEGRLHFHSEGPEGVDYRLPRSEEDTDGVPRSISYPQNLFVIGTVNIDETTYMFSPKVLDRANVIEFTVDSDEFGEFLNNPGNYPDTEPAKDGIAESFLQLANDAREGKLKALPEMPGQDIAKHLHNLFLIMQAGRFEFAYRTGKEVNRYLRVCRHLADDQPAWDNSAWKSDLDDQILQKILPKLHGSIGRVGGLLADLALYCAIGTIGAEEQRKHSSSQRINLALEPIESPTFPRSHAKLISMLRTLKEEQFVSFIQ